MASDSGSPHHQVATPGMAAARRAALRTARQERHEHGRLDQPAARASWRWPRGRCAADCSRPATPRDCVVGKFERIAVLAVGPAQQHVDRRQAGERFEKDLIAPHRQVARFGERVAEVAGEERVFEIVDAARRLAQQHDARLAIVLRREPGELFLAPR